MKVKIIIKAKKDFGTTLRGETMTLINEVFDAMTGIAFFPIDRSQWELVSYEQITEIKDNAENKLSNWQIMNKIEGIIKDNIYEVKYEGTEINKQSMKEELFTFIQSLNK